MADNDGITQFQSFTVRTLKFGRNLMAAALPIIVFALVPVVDLAKSRPLNFEITEGGEIWIWLILLALLMYYGFRFFGLAIPDFLAWREAHRSDKVNLKGQLKGRIDNEKNQSARLYEHHHNFDDATNPDHHREWRKVDAKLEGSVQRAQNEVRAARFEFRDYYWRRIYFWLVDAGLPVALFAVAAIAASIEINALLPTGTPPTP